MRINKFLALCQLGSRRKVEEFVLDKQVYVNGKLVTDLSFKVDENNDQVFVNGVQVQPINKQVYIMLNKPEGYLSSVVGQFGKPCVIDLITDVKYQIHPVGRLDFNSTGLLLLTNDGDFTNKVISPKFEIDKEYEVGFEGVLTQERLKKLSSEMVIDGYKIKPAKISNIKNNNNATGSLNIIIHEGRNRQIRKMFEKVGLKVKKLNRIRIGGLALKPIRVGEYVKITKQEAEKVFKTKENN